VCVCVCVQICIHAAWNRTCHYIVVAQQTKDNINSVCAQGHKIITRQPYVRKTNNSEGGEMEDQFTSLYFIVCT